MIVGPIKVRCPLHVIQIKKVRRSIGKLVVSWVLDTTGAPPWRLYTQTDGQDRGACVVAEKKYIIQTTVLAGPTAGRGFGPVDQSGAPQSRSGSRLPQRVGAVN